MRKYLNKYFYTELEVWSTDNKKRIDMIVIHKSDTQNKYPIGIEFKKDQVKRGKDIGLWVTQSMEYSEKVFTKYGRSLICTYPQISNLYLNEGDMMCQHDRNTTHHNNVNTFLAHFKIGELQKFKRNNIEYLRIVYNAIKIWDSNRDEFNYNMADKIWESL